MFSRYNSNKGGINVKRLKITKIITKALTGLLVINLISEGGLVIKATASTVNLSYEDGYVLGTNNEEIDLDSIVLDSNAGIKASDCTITDASDSLQVESTKIIPTESGVSKITFEKDGESIELLVLSKSVDEDEYVIYSENFDEIKDGTMPEGWTRTAGSTESKAAVYDGAFIIDAKESSDNPSRVLLPKYLNKFSNYKITADVTHLEANNNSRWNSITYRVQDDPNYYYQMAVRQNATASNGVEFAQWTLNNNWNVPVTNSYTEAISADKMYNYKVMIYKNRVQEYINDALMINTDLATEYTKGGVGFQANGSKMKVDNVKITLQEKDLPKTASDKYVDVNEITNNISMAPTTILKINSVNDADILNQNTLPANGWLKINSDINVISENGERLCSLPEAMELMSDKIIPAIEVEDEEAVTKLINYLKENEIEDVTVISENPELINKARTEYSILRGVLKFSDTEVPSDERLMEILKETNSCKAKIALLSSKVVNNYVAEYLQGRLISVWTDNCDNNNKEIHTSITSGVNGIVTNDFDKIVKAFSIYEKGTLVREPLIIGHRGVPSLAPENTIEGVKLAIEKGANVVENDLYLTKDNEIVIMHDDNLDRTTTGSGFIENYTLAELKEFYANKQFPTEYPDAKIPTLREYFDLVKGTDILIFNEIKTSNPNIIPALKALIEEYGVEENCVTISFNGDQIKRTNEQIPWISAGYLNGISGTSADTKAATRNILNNTQKFTSTYNPSYGCVNSNILEELKHRGTTAWPWTYNNYDAFKNHFKMGVYGLTTNYSQWSYNLVTDINIENNNYNLKKGDSIDIKATGNTYGRKTIDIDTDIVPIENDNVINIDGNKVTAEKAGEALVMLKTRVYFNDGDSYQIYSEPISVNVEEPVYKDLVINDFETSEKSGVKLGKTINLSGLAQGEGNLQYRFVAVSGNYKEVIQDFNDNNEVQWTPKKDGKYNIYLVAKDETGRTVQKRISSYIVKEKELNLFEINIDKAQTKVGEPITIIGNGAGTGKVKYRFVAVSGSYKEVIQDFTEVNKINWTPKKAGKYNIYVVVKDETGKSITRRVENYAVDESQAINIDNVSFKNNDNYIKINTDAYSSQKLQYQYLINDISTNSFSFKILRDYSEDSTVNWIPETNGTYAIWVNVKTENGDSMFKIVSYTVK